MPARNVAIGTNVKISDQARINVTDNLQIGAGTVVNRGALIEGKSVVIGRESWIDEYAHIGGGSCFERQSEFVAGDFLHMGRYSHVNTARRVKIGDEVGLGVETKVFTHGAYLSVIDGFPVAFSDVTIGNRVWLPHAWVNPGVRIGDDVVVAAMSLVNKDIPSGCLAGGIPVRILKENEYPKRTTREMEDYIARNLREVLNTDFEFTNGVLKIGPADSSTIFNLRNRKITGRADELSEKFKNQLRRLGIRFKYSVDDGVYKAWES
jgi:acetyltransferase-like isoleucine patch superfamily enzyme